jgi:hypothetical protein
VENQKVIAYEKDGKLELGLFFESFNDGTTLLEDINGKIILTDTKKLRVVPGLYSLYKLEKEKQRNERKQVDLTTDDLLDLMNHYQFLHETTGDKEYLEARKMVLVELSMRGNNE